MVDSQTCEPLAILRMCRTRAHLWIGLTLAAIAVLLFLPVLLHPHWGMFDDSMLIAEGGRRFADVHNFDNILRYGMRVGIFAWVNILWIIFPDNPRGYFCTNCVLFFGALLLINCNSRQICHRSKLGFLATILVLLAPGLFEVIYTLDKQEAYLPVLFGAVIYAHLYSVGAKGKFWVPVAFGTMLVSSCAYVSKETSELLLVFSGSLLGTLALVAVAQKNVFDRTQLLRSGILFIATVLPFLILRFCIFTVPLEQYVSMTFDFVKLAHKSLSCANTMPDFVIGLAICVTVWIYSV